MWRLLTNRRKWILFLVDSACYVISYAVILAIIFLSHPEEADKPYIGNAILFYVVLMLTRVAMKVYTNIWRYAGARNYLMTVISDLIGGSIALLLSHARNMVLGGWRNVSIVSVFCLASLSVRFAYQWLYQALKKTDEGGHKIGVAIVGAGQIGTLLANELTYNVNSYYKPICFIDRDPAKVGSKVCGLMVYDENDNIIDRIHSLPVQEIILALPKIDGEEAAKLLRFYSKTGCRVKMYDFPLHNDSKKLDGRRALREIHIEDLLFRNSLEINNEQSRAFYTDKTVLVTGGGGSIGSELCRQIAKCSPRRLIILDIYENNAYDIQQELIRTYGKELDLCVEIASVRDRVRLECVFRHYRPDIVFHAAAHKHVPLMEHSACESVKNNVMGTYNTADMSEKYGVKKFILISTDKAVNPTNVMGASKRMCEMVVQCRTDSETSFAAVRFGNVLGSNGSVIPLFRRQIAAGGPVTITDRRIIRYFMTIPEASQLVMQAGAMARSGELFVLDMGKPVKIWDLAENMIRLSGLVPHKDIEIKEIGLRPGEKLYEELLIKTEELDKTDN
jgi:FlaA1/EpsC-like NDP-sugar epimerase